MALVFEKSVNEGTTVAVWRIAETEEELMGMLQLNEAELALIDRIGHSKRYRHWLGSRVLIRHLLHTEQFIELGADANKKPVLHNFPHELSISHSGEMAAVILSEGMEVGIDLELIHPKVVNVRERFLSKEELAQIDDSDRDYYVRRLIQYWCGKEALYKLYARAHVDFRTQLFLAPTHREDVFEGQIRKAGVQNPFQVQLDQVDDYVIGYVAGNLGLNGG